MARRILSCIALLLLVLAGPAQALSGTAAPKACCCCGEAANPGQELGPCGMPKAPCPPRCPRSGASQALQAPALAAARSRTAQTRQASPRREPAPWPGGVACRSAKAAWTLRVPAAPSHGPPHRSPPWSHGDPQAGLRSFRI